MLYSVYITTIHRILRNCVDKMTPSSSQVVVAGHICLDLIPAFTAGSTVPAPGQLVQVGPAIVSTGGPVSNTGLALHHLGVPTQLMGKVGDDAFGSIVLDLVRSRSENLAQGIIVAQGETTSYSVVLSLPSVDRSFLHCSGANDTFCARDLKLETIAHTRLFHFGYPPLMAQMFADNGRNLMEVFQKVKSLGVTTSLDMVMVEPQSPAGQADWSAILRKALPHVDIFLPSIEELLVLLHEHTENQWLTHTTDDIHLQMSSLRELASRLLLWGAGIVVFKLGLHGIYMRTAGRQRLTQLGAAAPADLEEWANREIWSPIFKIDHFGGTTGAGDSAIAGFIAALLKEQSPENTMMFACAVGACNVEAADALSGLRTWEQTVLRIKNGWERQPQSFDEPDWHLHPASQSWLGPLDRQP